MKGLKRRQKILGSITVLGLLYLYCFKLSFPKKWIYKTTLTFTNQKWSLEDIKRSNLCIADANKKYDVYLELKNDIFNYLFQNIYIKYQMYDQQNKLLVEELLHIELFDNKLGIPFGRGFGRKRKHITAILKEYNFPETGIYTIQLTHFMRVEDLEGIVNINMYVHQKD